MYIGTPSKNIVLPGTRAHRPLNTEEVQRTIFHHVPRRIRAEVIALIGEFVGTFMFLFMAFSATQVANAAAPPTENNTLSQFPNSSNLLYISLAFGFSLAVNVWAFFRISGGLFNPAVRTSVTTPNKIPF